ncbi:hypothetical protein K435DRAFT_960164 [Dendrothele bispora CBS 962.96]|uniref:Uncharacterized protein n=1 Tax=Dendrothele bispora (strain CBS 962.96) TaxID=1314807 RepID=A0A4S8MUH9_DENBC|nr:hypothetical protein K435DRAFT_960164 [Dendrothele bispora CBS 962.96]
MSDTSSSDTSSRPSSPEPILDTRSQKSKEKSKAKASKDGKAEGTDPTWPFQPPENMSLLEDLGNSPEEFDWETLEEDEDLELWLIRVPEGVKPKYLENLTLKVPSSSSKTTRSGVLPRKHVTFDLWHIGDTNADEESAVAGGDEIKNISCLLPRKSKKGQMRLAPKPIARHLVINAPPAKPSEISIDSSSLDPAVTKQNPARFSYPEEMLKHRYVAFGSTSDARGGKDGGVVGEVDDVMDVDAEGGVPSTSAVAVVPPSSSKKKGSTKTSKAKRKELEDAETPKAKKPKKSSKK